MAAIFGEGKIFGKLQRLHSLDPLCEIERFCRNRSISHRVSKEIEANLCFANFGKNFRKSPTMAAIFGNFRNFFAKNGKTQICFYLLRYPVRDRAISIEIARSRTVKEYLSKFVIFANFGKKISKIPKNGGHFWEFSKIFAKIGKTQICFYLLRYPVRDRAISAKSLYLDTVTGVSKPICNLCNFWQNIFKNPQKWRPF